MFSKRLIYFYNLECYTHIKNIFNLTEFGLVDDPPIAILLMLAAIEVIIRSILARTKFVMGAGIVRTFTLEKQKHFLTFPLPLHHFYFQTWRN